LRYKLSKRKTSSCGQKLPKDWEAKIANIIAGIAHSHADQKSQQHTAHSGEIGNHKHRNLKTGGKENDRQSGEKVSKISYKMLS